MHEPTPSKLTPYAIGVVAIAVATVVRLLLDPLLGTRFPFATLFFAVLLSSWLGGFGPALLATVLGGVASVRFLLAPREIPFVDSVDNLAGLALYVVVSIGIALIGGAMRSARRAAEASALEAETQR